MYTDQMNGLGKFKLFKKKKKKKIDTEQASSFSVNKYETGTMPESTLQDSSIKKLIVPAGIIAAIILLRKATRWY